jgi:hypothetical protein
MKVIIDENLQGKELFKFLVENKSQLITQKKSMLKRTDAVSSVPAFFSIKNDVAVKTAIGEIPADATSVRVKIVGNTALWCDSQMDVLLPDCWTKSIKDRKGMIPHLHDHIHELDAEVGDVQSIYSQDVSLTELGLNKQGSTQSLIMESDVKQAYNPKVFNKYKTGRIKQHSIGLQYVKIGMAINDEDYVAEKELWDKYYPLVINQDAVNEKGFFFIVPEIKLLEVSAVLFGSNELTPTLDVNAKTDTPIEPQESTHDEPLQKSEAFSIEQLFKIF